MAFDGKKVSEVTENLKGVAKQKAEAFNELQAKFAEHLSKFQSEEAQKAMTDTDRETTVKMRDDLRVLREEINTLKQDVDLFGEMDAGAMFSEQNKEVKSDDESQNRRDLMRDLQNILGGSKKSTGEEKTVGQHFADILKARNANSVDYFKGLGQRQLKMVTGWTKDAHDVMAKENADMPNIKSLYSNYGVPISNESGHTGYQCAVYEDPFICQIQDPVTNMAECMTIKPVTAANRIRWTRMSARNNGVKGVPETIYDHPYAVTANLGTGAISANFLNNHNGTKPQSDFSLTTAETPIITLAHSFVVSNSLLEDCPMVGDMIDTQGMMMLERKKWAQIVAGTGAGGNDPEFLGLLNQPNVLGRTHIVDGEADDNIYDTLRRGATDIMLQGGDTANLCVVMNPRDIEKLDLTKDVTGNYMFKRMNCLTNQLECFKIVWHPDLVVGTAILGLLKFFIFYSRQEMRVEMGLVNNQFLENTVTIRMELRGATVLHCPQFVEVIDSIA